MWWTFAFVLLAVHLLQTTLFAFVGGGLIDLYLSLALVCGLVMPVHDARLAAVMTGFAQDLGSIGPLGTNAFALGLTGLVATLLRPHFNWFAWYSRALVTLLSALPGLIVQRLHAAWIQSAPGAGVWTEILQVLATAFIAAGIAVAITQLPRLGRRRGRRAELRALRR